MQTLVLILFWCFPLFAGYMLGEWGKFSVLSAEMELLPFIDALANALIGVGPYFWIWIVFALIVARALEYCRPEYKAAFKNVDSVMVQRQAPTTYGDLHSSMTLHPFKFIRYQGYSFRHILWSTMNFSSLGFLLFRSLNEMSWAERGNLAASLYLIYALMRIFREWVPGDGDFWAKQDGEWLRKKHNVRHRYIYRFLCHFLSFWKGGYQGRYHIWHCIVADTARVEKLAERSVFGHILSLLGNAWRNEKSSERPK